MNNKRKKKVKSQPHPPQSEHSKAITANQSNNQSPSLSDKIKKKLTNTWAIIFAVLGGIATITGMSVYQIFKPDVEIANTATLDPKDVDKMIFVVHNKSFFVITDVIPYIRIDSVAYPNRNTLVGFSLYYDKGLSKLASGDKASFMYPISSTFKNLGKPIFAKLVIVMDYKFLGVSHKEAFPFACLPDYKGDMVVVPWAEDDTPERLPNLSIEKAIPPT